MKILFITEFQTDIQHEHFFTKQVIDKLINFSSNEILLASAIDKKEIDDIQIEKNTYNNADYYVLYIPNTFNIQQRISAFKKLYNTTRPDVIHSNMIEGFAVEAATALGIPICITIHIGGIICPRAGGNGFLMYNDSICNQAISNKCLLCQSKNLPFSYISYILLRFFPKKILDVLKNISKNRFIFYFTEFCAQKTALDLYKKRINIFKKATLVAANHRLKHILELNGLSSNVKVIPHGVIERKRLDFPIIQKVKFFFLGRIQYSKGLHILLKALERIDSSRYELHIIGDSDKRKKEQRYYHHIKNMSKGLNVIFHGRIPNDTLEQIISNYHVMIHPAIFLEVYGIAIAESLSMGRPVLATRCGGAEMQVIDGYNGWLVKPNSILSLHHTIHHIIDNPEEILRYSKNAHIPHNINNYINELDILYEKLKESKCV